MSRRSLGRGAVPALALAVVLGARGAAADPPPQAFDPGKELLRIAKMRQDDRLLASFAEARGRAAPNLTEKELFAIVDTVEKVGTPDHAIRMLQDRVKKFPKEIDAHVSLAKMYVRASQTPSAVPVWKQIALRFGLTPALALESAHVLSATGDHAGSLAVLASIRDKTPDDALEYWRELAAAAWDQDQTATALQAYRKVWKADPPVPAASSRLMQLLADAGELDEAIVVAKQALVRERNPAHLLFVARLQITRGDIASAKRTLDLAEDQRALIASTLEYWMLRADVLSRLGDKDGARAAHRIALHLDPSAPGVRAALLWDSIDRSDLRTLAVDLKEWIPEALRDRELWAPTAVGLDRIGRTRDAIRFFALQAKETPLDHLWSLEFSEALARVGEESMSLRLRRRAFAGIRALALTALTRPPPGRTPAAPLPVVPVAAPATPAAPVLDAATTEKVLQAHVFLTQQLRGEPEAERLVRRMLATKKPSLELEEFAVGWYLQEDNVDTARRHLAKARLQRLERSSSRRYALLVAMAEDDRVEIERLLDAPSDLSDGERAAAYLRIERDDRAAQPIISLLDQVDTTADVQGSASVLPPDSDAPTLRRELRAIEERKAMTVRAGGTFEVLNSLAVIGPTAGGSYQLGATRLMFRAGARQYEDLGSSAVDVGGRREADAELFARRLGPRHFTEYRAAVDYQTNTPNGIPIPRLGYTGVFQLGRKVVVGIDVAANGRIEDTSFLRVAGLRDSVTADIVLEPARKFFLIGTIVTLEDHTRTFKFLGAEAGGGVEGGYKILEKVPEWSVGARVGAYGRGNRGDVPVDYRSIVKANESRASLYPPSYQQTSFVMRVARGDFFDRARQDLVDFPRYDCELDVGVLFGLGIRGARAAAVGTARCAISVRVPSHGYLSVSGEYIKGVTGLAQSDNALAGVTFTQLLR